MMRQKIVFLEAVQNFGGARKSTIELAARLSKVHDVQIIDFYGSCKPFCDAANRNELDLKIADQRNNPFVIKKSSSRLKNCVNLFRFIPHWFRIRKIIHGYIRDFKADYVIVNNSKTLSILFIFKSKGFKTLFFARGWFVSSQISRRNRFLFNYVDRFICVAEATRHAFFCSRITTLDNLFVVHNAINEDSLPRDTASIAVDSDTIKILHSGGFLPEKGQHISLEIASILKTKGIKFKIILAGIIYSGHASQGYYDSIVKKIQELDIANEVEIVKDMPDIIPYFRACDILIHPSATEGLPRSIMEAMVLKKPVIANAVGGVIDYILHGFTGYITNFNNPQEYASYIEVLHANQAKYDFIASNAYSLVKETFTETEQVRQLMNVFNLR